MSNPKSDVKVLDEEPTSNASLTILRTPEGETSLKAEMPPQQAGDLLPMTAIVAAATGPALALAVCNAGGVPYWLSIPVAVIQMCGIILIVNCKRT